MDPGPVRGERGHYHPLHSHAQNSKVIFSSALEEFSQRCLGRALDDFMKSKFLETKYLLCFFMVLILDGDSEIGAYVGSNLSFF